MDGGRPPPGASGRPSLDAAELAALAPYRERLAQALRDGPEFWAGVAREELVWRRPFSRALDWDPPFARWFPDGTLNAAENCLDRHLATAVRDRVAYHWEGEDGAQRRLTYAELAREVQRMASGIAADGFGPGDFAAIYLPMVPELPVAMLALARLGIAFTTVFSGFSAEALASRITDLNARLLITADGGWRRGKVVPLKAIADAALAHAPSVRRTIVVRRTGEPVSTAPARDVEWTDVRAQGRDEHAAAAFPSDQLLYLLYSSGTTGVPKAIAHGTGGYLTHVRATMRWVFDLRPDDRFWCAADIGWVTGHSYIVFGPLANGVTSLLYEGAFDHPTASRFYELIDRHRITVLHTSPTALRALRKHGDALARAHELASLRLLGSVGEAINPEVWHWYHDVVGRGRCPIVDTWWQTETGGMLVSPAPGLGTVPLKAGSATLPLPGVDADVVNEHGKPAAPGERGYAVVRSPWPGMLLGLYGDPDRFRRSYWERFPGCYYAGDYAVKDADGYFWFLGRADEVLKVAAHRLGTIEIESALLTHPAVAEAAVCGVADAEKGEVPVAYVVLRATFAGSSAVAAELRRQVDERIGKFARPARIYFVRLLPKTRSGKIMRRVVRAVAQGEREVGDVTTLEDGASIEEVRQAFDALRDAHASAE